MRKYKFLSIFPLLIVLGILFNIVGSHNDVLETKTEQIKVISKDNSSDEQWIIPASEKKIYIENFSYGL